MKKFFTILVALSCLLCLPQSTFAQEIPTSKTVEGEVIEISKTGKETFMDELVDFQELKIQLNESDETITIKNSAATGGLTNVQYQTYAPGDKLRIVAMEDMNGQPNYAIDGKVKRQGLIGLLILFVFLVLVIGRLWGALSLLGLVISFVVIFKFTLPLIIKGVDPVLAAILGSLIIIPSTFYVSHGFNKKTHVGVIATTIALIITGILANYFVKITYLTGFSSEEAGFLQVETGGAIDIKGLLLAGIIIGTLGILDDITIGQASTVEQLKEAKPKMKIMELFINSMKVGQDHISSMVNTLVLVYSGSALPFLLLFFDSQKTFVDVIELEVIAEEIVRMLVGSIGLVLSAPLAAITAALLFSKTTTEKNHQAVKSK